MMKAILSNGEKLQLNDLEHVTLHVEGDKTKGVTLAICDITEVDIRRLLSDMANFSAVEVYSDTNIFIEELTGYQVKYSVALGEEDNSYILTLARGTDTTARVEAMAADLERGLKTITEALSTISKCSSSIQEIAPQLTTLIAEKETVRGQLETHTDAVNDVLKSFQEINGQLTTAVDAASAATRKELEIERVVIQIKEREEQLSGQIGEAVSTIRNIYQTADDLFNSYRAKISKIEHIEKLSTETRDLVASNDNNIQLAVGKVEKVDGLVEKVTEDITNQNETVKNVKEKAAEAVRTVSNMESRIVALEPVNDITKLPLDDAKRVRVAESEQKLAEFLEANPITSTCHGGVAAQYSITAEKQRYLQSMILLASTANANGVSYQPSWNAAGQPCTYDWTVEELQQLAMEIETVVRPVVSQQQKIEMEIRNSENMEALQAVNITYYIPTITTPTVPPVTSNEPVNTDTVVKEESNE